MERLKARLTNTRPFENLKIGICLHVEAKTGVCADHSGLEHTVIPGVVESIKVITEKASTRIAQYAFEFAKREGRKKATAMHKANIMKLSDGLFLECFLQCSKGFSGN